MPIGAEVNAILVLLKVCNGAGWRAAPDICVHHKILSKLSVINLKYTLETCLWDHEKEAGQGGERAWEREGIRAARGLGNNGTSFRRAHPPSAGSSGLLHRRTPSSILLQALLSAYTITYSKQLLAVKYGAAVSIFKAELSILHLLVQKPALQRSRCFRLCNADMDSIQRAQELQPTQHWVTTGR